MHPWESERRRILWVENCFRRQNRRGILAADDGFSVDLPEEGVLLDQLEAAYKLWEPQPTQLFELRDDQFEREPAYKLLTTDGSESAGDVLIAWFEESQTMSS